MNSASWHPLHFGSRRIDGNVLCAPLAGYTDIAYREQALAQGAAMCYTEMVSCEALVRENGKTVSLLARAQGESDYGIQLFTASAEAAAGSMRYIEAYNPVVIDLNCGCPVPKVVKGGAGSALMKEPKQIAAIVAAMKRETSLPVSVKLRTGWDHQNYTFLEAGLRAEEAGACLVTLHGRTRSQGYGGTADWEKIARLKEALSIPVVGNGDIFAPDDAIRMLSETGCDGVMVARGAIGNPFIFAGIRALLEGREVPEPPSPQLRIETALAQLERAIEIKSERTAVKEMKKQLCAYTKGIPGSAGFRNQLVHSESAAEYREFFKDFLASLG